jgi:hypothetical protein
MTCLRVGRLKLRAAAAPVQRILLTPRPLCGSEAPLARNRSAIGRRRDVTHLGPVRRFAIAWIAGHHAILIQQMDVTAAIVSRGHCFRPRFTRLRTQRPRALSPRRSCKALGRTPWPSVRSEHPMSKAALHVGRMHECASRSPSVLPLSVAHRRAETRASSLSFSRIATTPRSGDRARGAGLSALKPTLGRNEIERWEQIERSEPVGKITSSIVYVRGG